MFSDPEIVIKKKREKLSSTSLSFLVSRVNPTILKKKDSKWSQKIHSGMADMADRRLPTPEATFWALVNLLGGRRGLETGLPIYALGLMA